MNERIKTETNNNNHDNINIKDSLKSIESI